MAIPAPREVDALMRRVPPGRVVTINELRSAVARQHGAAIGCPLTTGIFSWLAAHAAAEAAAAGETSRQQNCRILRCVADEQPRFVILNEVKDPS
jgi:hypothetical protein